MRIGLIYLLGWYFIGSIGNSKPMVENCVFQRETTICYGSLETSEGKDWWIETSDATGRRRQHTERLPYDQEARHVAVSIQDGWILYVVHSRWMDEFSIRLETKWELLKFESNGSLRTRVDLPGKPNELVDALGFLFVRFPDGSVRTYDGTLQASEGIPLRITIPLSEVQAILPYGTWHTPSGEICEFDGVGHYLFEWSASNGWLVLPVTVIPEIWGVADDQIYLAPIRWGSTWPVLIDGQPAGTSGIIADPGFHVLVVEGRNGFRIEWTFRLEASLYGLPLQPAVGTVRLYANASMTLNGHPYASGTPIERAGTYELILMGSGGYSKTYAFVVASSANGVTEGGTYQAPFAFFVNGVGLLNGRTVSGDTRIQEPGQYELAFFEEGIEPRFVNFTVIESTEPTMKFDPLPFVQVGLAVIGLIGLVFVRKRK